MSKKAFILGAVLWLSAFAGYYFFQKSANEQASAENQPPVGRELDSDVFSSVDIEPAELPPFSFVDRTGETVTNDDLAGRPYLISFVFQGCTTTCPDVSSAMREAYRRFDDSTPLRFVSLTVDPERDTREVLTQYAQVYGAPIGGDWLFLRGEREKTYRLIEEGFQQPVKRQPLEKGQLGDYQVLHSNRIFFVDENGVLTKSWNALSKRDRHDLADFVRKTFAATKEDADEAPSEAAEGESP